MSRRPVLALGAALVAGCGLTGGSPSEPWPGDGINDFGDAAPIEFCLGTGKLVPPSSALGLGGSVCVGEGTAATSCTSDSQCSGVERCLCGRCIVEACSGAGSCTDGRICAGSRCTKQCVSDSECPGGEVCAGGGCARPCSGDGDCSFGERCDSLDSVCASQLCSDSIPCASGDRCEPTITVGELHEPDVVTLGGETFAFVEIRSGDVPATRGIYRARVESPTRWRADPPKPVVTSPSEPDLGAPSALVTDAGVDLWFQVGDGKSIGHATSRDQGAHFTIDDLAVLAPEEPWENGWVGSPGVVTFHGDRVLFFEGGPRAGVGVAKAGGAAFARVTRDPVVTPKSIEDPYFWRATSAVRAPFAVVADDVLRVYFTGRGAEGTDAVVEGKPAPADVSDSIGMFATRDLKTFHLFPSGPVYARLTNLRAFLGESEAWVGVHPGGDEIVFVAADASGEHESGLSRAGGR